MFVVRIRHKSYHLLRAYQGLSAFYGATVDTRVDLKHLAQAAAYKVVNKW